MNQQLVDEHRQGEGGDTHGDTRGCQEKPEQQKRQIEDQKIQLEKDKMKHETELQKAKDDAAYEREKLKARTAIRNKTNAEAARSK